MAYDVSLPAAPVLPPRVVIDPVLRDFERTLESAAERDGLSIHLDDDMAAFVRHLAAAERNDGVNPALDPAQTDLDDAFWLRIEHRGQIVGVMGQRFLDCAREGYYDIIRRGLFFGRDRRAPLEILIDEPGALGRACFGGGIYVAPSHRGTGLAWLIPQYARAVAVRIWNLNAAYGMVFDVLRENGVARASYGGSRYVRMVDGFFPPKGGEALVWSIEHEIPTLIESMRATIHQAQRGDHKVSDLAPRRPQRKH